MQRAWYAAVAAFKEFIKALANGELIANLFREHGALLTSRQVEQLLTADGDSEWANYKGHPINKWEIASLLKPYGIAPAVIHPRGRAADRGYDMRQFETVFRHYLPPESSSCGRTVVRKPRGKPRK